MDSGPGMKEEELPFVFERFYKTAGRGRGDGSGLGLSIAKSFVELHGGTANAFNQPQGGSIVEFFLPTGTSESC